MEQISTHLRDVELHFIRKFITKVIQLRKLAILTCVECQDCTENSISDLLFAGRLVLVFALSHETLQFSPFVFPTLKKVS